MEDPTAEELVVIHDVPIPRGYRISAPKSSAQFWQKSNRPPVKAEPAPDVIMDVDVDDDDSSDGGVQLDSISWGQVNGQPGTFNPQNASQVTSHYHQDQNLDLENMSEMWQLPVPSLNSVTRIEIKTLYGNAASMRHYHQSCRTLRSAWGCDAENCIPDSLRASTPYSLTLLRALRRLAKMTQGHPEEARRLLDQAWCERYRKQGLASYQAQVKIVRTVRTSGNNDEPVVRENLFGLMTADVLEAIKVASQPNKRVAKAPRQTKKTRVGPDGMAKAERRKLRRQTEMRMELGGASQLGAPPSTIKNPATPLETSATVAERVTKKRRQRKANKFAPLEKINEDSVALSSSPYTDNTRTGRATAPPNSPVNTGMTFQLAFRPSHNDPPGQAQSVIPQQALVTENITPTNLPNTDTQAEGNPRRIDKTLSYGLDRVTLEAHAEERGARARQKRMRQLEAGGWSRKGRDDVRMPSERFDLNSVPTLHALAAAATSQGDLEKMGQRALPD